MELKVKRIDKSVPMPRYANEGDAGFDLRCTEGVTIQPNETVIVGTGIAVEVPDGHVGLCFPRSGMASHRDVSLANCVGVVDAGYRGEVKAPLHNIGVVEQVVAEHERVFQMVVIPFDTCEFVEVEELSETERGQGGFGSSGTGLEA